MPRVPPPTGLATTSCTGESGWLVGWSISGWLMVVAAVTVSTQVHQVISSTSALWVWHTDQSPLVSAAASAEFFTFVQHQTVGNGTRLALVEVEGLGVNTTVTSQLAQLLVQAHQNNVDVAALYGWSGRGGAPFPATAEMLSWVQAATELGRTYPALTGISLDIEPSGTAQGSYQQYADLLAAIRRALNAEPVATRLQLSIAGSWGYDTVNVSCRSSHPVGRRGDPVRALTATMLQCAVTFVDLYILMNYRNNAYGCFCRPPPGLNSPRLQCPADGSPIAGNCSEASGGPGKDGMIGKALAAATAVQQHGGGCRLALGVETSCFPPSDVADRKYQYKLSFCNTSVTYLEQQLGETRNGLQQAGLWDGVMSAETPWALEDYTALRELERMASTPW
jgi:hypothetical protein